ncbi:hypothetical protein [Pseudoduganella sp. R-43]|uniref:hypothetical protein n=1 Tax=unclassified Pseudoduganella TaxID=2637179 RepID=UPI003CF62F19
MVVPGKAEWGLHSLLRRCKSKSSSDLGSFILDYRNESAKFTARGCRHPVILLVDNDSGVATIYSIPKQITKSKVTGHEPSVHIAAHLYLPATLVIAGAAESLIGIFYCSTNSIVVRGKTFDLKLDEETEKHYWKVVFCAKGCEGPGGKDRL